ncbi:DUF4266 domain-containing protein [Undibacterium flavidum]|uniref:DUF4266 domain-containing protein n=1 Tax=Undibacterium flavidum TaxID=2762297 RepID=A0ABR6YE76_9BURK|nr:DUF4266 domain-containing protein [Undibacterium flavidum]MBC3874817.1 DUF4266 domain-containing protein [Undibacterium flavidum]
MKELQVKTLKILPGLCAICLLSGCASLNQVQAWEKGKLARQEMKFDRDPLEAKFVDHIYFSKEAATGGNGVGGGGCGCN